MQIDIMIFKENDVQLKHDMKYVTSCGYEDWDYSLQKKDELPSCIFFFFAIFIPNEVTEKAFYTCINIFRIDYVV